jgi:hypothetical protein
LPLAKVGVSKGTGITMQNESRIERVYLVCGSTGLTPSTLGLGFVTGRMSCGVNGIGTVTEKLFEGDIYVNEELKRKIMEDIKKTGFITELEIGSLLLRNGWRVGHSSSYNDKDLEKAREIDIIAYKGFYNEEIDFRFGIQLIFEIKKTSRHWVIFYGIKFK